MSIGSQAIVDALVSHALTLGRFDRVNAYEPKSAPGSGLTAALWVQEIRPVPTSGLGSTSVLFTVQARIYQNMLSEPLDAIDPSVADAADVYLANLSAGFTLGGIVREVDLLGQNGTGLSAVAGYVAIDATLYRCLTLTIPLIVNDAWTQGA